MKERVQLHLNLATFNMWKENQWSVQEHLMTEQMINRKENLGCILLICWWFTSSEWPHSDLSVRALRAVHFYKCRPITDVCYFGHLDNACGTIVHKYLSRFWLRHRINWFPGAASLLSVTERTFLLPPLFLSLTSFAFWMAFSTSTVSSSFSVVNLLSRQTWWCRDKAWKKICSRVNNW